MYSKTETDSPFEDILNSLKSPLSESDIAIKELVEAIILERLSKFADTHSDKPTMDLLEEMHLLNQLKNLTR